MTLPFAFPSWAPWWVPLVVLAPALLYGLVFLAMPFSVFGVKARLDILEARLDEIQGEIRSLSLRLPEPGRDFEPEPRTRRDAQLRPPIPPAAVAPTIRTEPDRRFAAQVDEIGAPARSRFGGEDPQARRAPPPMAPPPRRAEPRIDWPRPQS